MPIKILENKKKIQRKSKREKFIDLINQYLEVGELPVSSTIDAKKFIDTKVVDKL